MYDVTRLVPRGRITSYGAIARYLGTGRFCQDGGLGAELITCHTRVCSCPPRCEPQRDAYRQTSLRQLVNNAATT
ncbi:MAG: hypothetical protein MZV63_48160 [Marinilabiliales bacterium]|nr:hypothetical protein [Marinilabiliales bacterium]